MVRGKPLELSLPRSLTQGHEPHPQGCVLTPETLPRVPRVPGFFEDPSHHVVFFTLAHIFV